MGFRSWEFVGIKVDEAEMLAAIAALAKKRDGLDGLEDGVSLVDLGYTDVAIDDGWQPVGQCHHVPGAVHAGFHRADGSPIIDRTRFPGGMEAMAASARAHSLTFSWYTNNCGCAEGGYTDPQEIDGHYRGDIDAMARWSATGLKVDGCSQFNNMTRYQELLEARRERTGQNWFTESCHGTHGCKTDPTKPGGILPDPSGNGLCPHIREQDGKLVCPFHFFRVSADVSFSFDSVLGNANALTMFENISRPGCWAHPDMLEVGNLWTAAEDRANFGLYAIASAPLILSFNMTNERTLRRALPTITNREVIAINQDEALWAGSPGRLVKSVASVAPPRRYLWAVACDDPQVAAQRGWAVRPVAAATTAATTAAALIQVVAPHGWGCLDLNSQAPLTLEPCEGNPDPVTSSQALSFDEATGHLGKAHPMQDGTLMGYVNIAGGDKPGPGPVGHHIRGVELQFTYSYGPDQANEEYEFKDDGTFSDRCGAPGPHPNCTRRCVIANTTAPFVDNNSQNSVLGVGWQVWAKPLSDGSVAALVINRDVAPSLSATLDLDEIGVPAAAAAAAAASAGGQQQGGGDGGGGGGGSGGGGGGVRIRDLWAKKDLATIPEGQRTYRLAPLAPHDSHLLRLFPVKKKEEGRRERERKKR